MRALEDLGKLILRLAVAVLLVLHGIAKVRGGVGFIEELLANAGLPAFIAYGVYLAEILAPVLLILGVFTRPAALVIVFDMVMAMTLALRDQIGTIKEQGGGWAVELEMFFLLASLAIACLGSGRFALSRGLGRWD
jgi:putative oxidoreductase